MQITLEQARAFDALATHGTFVRAAKALKKGHTAVLYAIEKLEEQTGLALLDRSAYRTRLTPAGERVLEHCKKLLAEERQLAAACTEMKSGWEPSLGVVFDGIFPAAPILRAAFRLAQDRAPTRIDVASAFLDRVEEAFVREERDVMISVLPVTTRGLRSIALGPIAARLVAHRSHPLGKLARKKARIGRDELSAHVLVTVRGSDPRLQLPTASIEPRSTIRLSDFEAKKAAILQGVGFGWLPDHLVADETERGELVVLPLERAGRFVFAPRLWHRDAPLGRAASVLVAALTDR